MKKPLTDGQMNRSRKPKPFESVIDRPSAARRGYDRKWREARASWLREHPLCVECETKGRFVAAVVVDHIVPHRGDLTLFWDRLNWQSLCTRHATIKTARGE